MSLRSVIIVEYVSERCELDACLGQPWWLTIHVCFCRVREREFLKDEASKEYPESAESALATSSAKVVAAFLACQKRKM